MIDWLWYPYIPFGKITVIQGDPGDGKTTTVLAIAAVMTTPARMLSVYREANDKYCKLRQIATGGNV